MFKLLMRIRRDERGFTFVELMVTAAVVSIVLIGLVAGNMMIQRTNEGAYERAIAVQDASRVIESIRNTVNAGQSLANATVGFPNNGTVNGFNNLANEQVVVTYADPAANQLLDVTVTVTWLQNGMRQASQVLRTFIALRAR